MKRQYVKYIAILVVVGVLIGSGFCLAEEYKVKQEDVLQITVHEQPDLTTIARVSAEGTITFPLLGTVKVSELTVREVEMKLRELLLADYLVDPQVLVYIQEYSPKQVSVIGWVNSPGKYDMFPEKETTVLEAIAMAGGFSKEANVNGTRILRVEDGEEKTIPIRVKDITEKGEKDKDIPLKPNDVVFVPESFF